MKYKIIGTTLPIVELTLNSGEKVFTQSGGMTYESDGISMTTNAKGGIMGSLGRMFTGESLFLANYTAEKDNSIIGFSASAPGSIVPIDISSMPQGIVMQKGAFLCAEDTVELKAIFTKKITSGFFGGEGFILQQATGKGQMFLEVDGDIIEKELLPDEVLKVDTGNVVAFEPSVKYEIEMIKGIGNILLGGEGLFLTKLVGPGKVIIQSQNFKDFATRIIPYIPRNSD